MVALSVCPVDLVTRIACFLWEENFWSTNKFQAMVVCLMGRAQNRCDLYFAYFFSWFRFYFILFFVVACFCVACIRIIYYCSLLNVVFDFNFIEITEPLFLRRRLY